MTFNLLGYSTRRTLQAQDRNFEQEWVAAGVQFEWVRYLNEWGEYEASSNLRSDAVPLFRLNALKPVKPASLPTCPFIVYLSPTADPTEFPLTRGLTDFANLPHLVISGAVIGDEELEIISKISGLRHLELECCQLTGKWDSHLSRFRDLRHLRVKWNQSCIPPVEFVTTLAALPELESLAMEGPNWEVGVAPTLVGFRNLRCIAIGNEALTAQWLRNTSLTPRLEALVLQNVHLSQEGLALVNSIAHLKSLELRACDVEGNIESVFSLTTLERLAITNSKRPIAEIPVPLGTNRLRWLNLSGTWVSPKACSALGGFQSLAELNLSESGLIEEPPDMFSPEGFANRWQSPNLTALGSLTKLVVLNLQGTPTNDDSIKGLQGLAELQSLDLSRTRVQSVAAIGKEFLPSLVRLKLDGTQVDDRFFHSFFSILIGLRELSLRDTKVHCHEKDALANFPNLQFLDLGNTQLESSGLASIDYLSELKELHLDGTLVDDKIIPQLLKLDALRKLHVSEFNLAPGGLTELKNKLPLLQFEFCELPNQISGLTNRQELAWTKAELRLRNGKLPATTLCRRPEEIERMADLSQISLSINEPINPIAVYHLGNIKAALLPSLSAPQAPFAISLSGKLDAPMIRWLSTLREMVALDISACQATDDKVELSPLANLVNLTHVDAASGSASPELMKILSKLPKLVSLNLGYNHELDPESLGDLGNCKTLTTLNLANTLADDETLKAISGCGELCQLNLNDTRIRDRGLEFLAALKKLKVLSLRRTVVSGKGLSNLRHLEVLVLDNTRVNDDSLETIAGLSNLRCLSVSGDLFQGSGLRHLSSLANLEFLAVSSAELSDADMADIAKLHSLVELRLSAWKVSDEGLKHLESLKNLRKLSLSCPGSSEAIRRLQRALPDCKF